MTTSNTALPPGPSSALWQTLRYVRDPVGMVSSLAAKYGDPFTLPTLIGPVVCTARPDDIRTFFGADPDTFSPFADEGIASLVLGRGSLLIQHGATHRRRRKLMTPMFHHGRVRAYAETMIEITARHLREAPTARFKVEQLFRSISLEVILQTVFGLRGQERIEAARGSVLSAISALGPMIALFSSLRHDWFPPWKRFRRLLGETHALLAAEIATRRAATTPGDDICSLLVAARDEDGQPLADQEIIEQLFTMVVAGHETTATTLAWAVDEVWRQPALLGRLREQLAPAAGDPEKLVADKLLDAVCAETLRLRPLVAIVGRRLERPFTLAGIDLPVGAAAAACTLLAHRDPTTYPDPDTFRPERFLDGRTFSPSEYLPWGGGARRCIGAAFAMYEMKLVLAAVVLGDRQLELTAPRARTGARAATLGPRNGVPVIYRPSPVAVRV